MHGGRVVANSVDSFVQIVLYLKSDWRRKWISVLAKMQLEYMKSELKSGKSRLNWIFFMMVTILP